MYLKLLTSIISLLFVTQLVGQSISVIFIEGEAYSQSNTNGKDQYVKLQYGPLLQGDNIIVKQNSKVKLVKDKKMTVELDSEGTYLISTLRFEPIEKNSMFDKFCDYFHSFFSNHTSAESKANYTNTIYAISRGNVPPPSLDFPMEGRLPIDVGPVPFIWTHACDTCEYIFSIHELSSKDMVYSVMTKDHRVSVNSPMTYLKSGVEYYWKVKMVGSNLEDVVGIFTPSPIGDYTSKVEAITADLNREGLTLTPLAKTIYTISIFDAEGLVNYAILHGFDSVSKSLENKEIQDALDRYWYDLLLESR